MLEQLLQEIVHIANLDLSQRLRLGIRRLLFRQPRRRRKTLHEVAQFVRNDGTQALALR
jgi:hypothetical protein